jgi:hypothetical protein
MTHFTTGDGNTPLSPEEQDDLIPDLTTKEERNEWERQNILEAYEWALDPRNLNRRDPFAEAYVRELHLRMFDQTWKWAGIYRSTEKNIGIPHYQIREALAGLLGDVRIGWNIKPTSRRNSLSGFIIFWCGSSIRQRNDLHARLMADVVAQREGRPVFTWGGADSASRRLSAQLHRSSSRC